MSQLQLPFIENSGQLGNADIRFLARTPRGALLVMQSGELVYSLPGRDANRTMTGWTITETFINGHITRITGLAPHTAGIKYFRGPAPSQTGLDTPGFMQVSMAGIYPGIDLLLAARGNNIEKLFIVKPYSDPTQIKALVSGSNSLSVNDNGQLEVATGLGAVRFTRPVAFQEIAGQKKFIEVAYVAHSNEYSFQLGVYDPARELIIDPLLASTFIGEIALDGQPTIDLLVDASENVFITGSAPTDFPTTAGGWQNAYDNTHNGDSDLFILRLASDLSSVTAASFIGGSNSEAPQAIVAANNHIYITGSTSSTNFPIIAGNDGTANGGGDIFVAKLTSDLTTLVGSTYLGGSSTDTATALAADAAGNIFVAGYTTSNNFPVTDASVFTGTGMAFLTKFDAGLTHLAASTLYGGNDQEEGSALAVSNDSVYLGGFTASDNLPAADNGFQSGSNGGGEEAFIARFSTSLELLIATYLGGTEKDRIFALKYSGGKLYVAGGTGSADFPVQPGAYNTTFIGDNSVGSTGDAFVGRFSSDLQHLEAATFLGGNDTEIIADIDILANGAVVVGGETLSADYPITDGTYQPVPNTPTDGFLATEGFLTILSHDLESLIASTFLGSSARTDHIDAVRATDGSIYVGGYTTQSTDFPITDNAWLSGFTGTMNGFISRFDHSLAAGQAAQIIVTPENYAFGDVVLGEADGKQFTINNNGTLPLIISTISTSTNDAALFEVDNDSDFCSGQSIDSSQSCTVAVTFSPLTTGAKSTSLIIASNDISRPQLTIPLTGSGINIPQYTLTIIKDGPRPGTITSTDAKINCGPDCSETYLRNTQTTISASWNADTTIFSGWTGGGCVGTGNCLLTMNADTTVKATFRDFIPSQVSKTGQTTCFTASDTTGACPGTGQDGELQAGIIFPDSRFSYNGNGTVTDNLTGLVWLEDVNCFAANDSGVNWQEAIARLDDFNAAPNSFDCADYTADFDDWSLPNVNELESLLNYELVISKNQWLDDAGFITELTNRFGDYWTSTTRINTANDSSHAWVVNFTTGAVSPQNKSTRAYLWPVRFN